MRKYPPHYEEMSEETQKTGAYPINKRTISNRLVFRLRHVQETDKNLQMRADRLREITEKLYQVLLEEKLGFKAYQRTPHRYGFAQFFLEKEQECHKTKPESRACGRITFSVHNDYITISTTLSLGNCNFADPVENVPTLASAVSILKALRSGFKKFESGRVALLNELQQINNTGPDQNPRNRAIEQASKALFYQVWNRWDQLYFSHIFETDELEIVADVRGVIIPRFYESEHFSPLTTAQGLREVPPFASDPYSREVVTTLQPLFAERNGWKYRELIGCTMFGERAVFLSPVSTIKLKVDQKEMRPNVTPICFALAPHFNNVWQSGRMVHRINMLATYQTLSLCDIERFRSVSTELKKINLTLHQCRTDYFDFINQKTKILEAKHDGHREWLAGINKRIQQITAIESNLSQFHLKTAQPGSGSDLDSRPAQEKSRNSQPTNGATPLHAIEYDLYRSALVAERFRTQIGDLRVKRIEGWQPYDEYARRRVFPLQDYTSRVSDRLLEIRSAIDELLQSALAEIEAQNSEGILLINEKIYSAHKFQLLVETIAIAYYGGYALSGVIYTVLRYSPIVEKLEKKFKIKDIPVNGFEFSLNDKDILYNCIALTTVIALARYFRKSSSH